MARRGCASERRKQLQRLKKALYEHREFDPSVFDRITSTSIRPTPPAYRSYVAPASKEVISKITSTPILKAKTRIPAHPIASDVAPIRLRTRPLPVSAQIKRRDTINRTQITRPRILSIEATKIIVKKEGDRIILKRKIPVNSSQNAGIKINAIVTIVQLDDGREWKRHINQMRKIGMATPNDKQEDLGPRSSTSN